jgi:hypothetical protein
MSGYTLDVVTERGVFNEDSHFIQKSFGINAVLDKIDKVLNEQKETTSTPNKGEKESRINSSLKEKYNVS